MRNGKKIGIYGGTFSPVHKGHVSAATAFLREEKLDKLYIIPAGIPPHKDIYPEDSALDRCRMLEMAFSPHPEYGKKMFISDYEINRPGKSYTYNTLLHYSEESDNLSLLCGTDMFLTLDSWYRAKDIFSMADIVCVRRENDIIKYAEIARKREEYIRDFSAEIRILDIEPFEISSNAVRDMIISGENAGKYLPDGVYEYIKKKKLYSDK